MAAGHGVVGWGIWDPPSRERVRECEIETDRQTDTEGTVCKITVGENIFALHKRCLCPIIKSLLPQPHNAVSLSN